MFPIGRSAKTFKIVGGCVQELLDRYGLQGAMREIRLVLDWPTIVGNRIASRTAPTALKDGVLYLHATNSSWQHQLSFFHSEMIAKINNFIGPPPLVHTVRWTSRREPPPEAHDDLVALSAAQKHSSTRQLPAPSLDPAIIRRIQHETSTITDDELREAIREFRIRMGV